MTTLVIGGDHIDRIRAVLAEHDLEDVEHWPGRKPGDAKRTIPARVRLLVVVIDQLSHNLLYSVTLRAIRLDLPIIYTRRSGQELHRSLVERSPASAGRPSFRPVSEGWAIPYEAAAFTY